MTTAIGTPWADIRRQELADPVEALGYLKFLAEEDPAMMPKGLDDVLDASPHLAGVAIPRYAHLLTAADLAGLADRYPEASRYISEYRAELALLLSA